MLETSQPDALSKLLGDIVELTGCRHSSLFQSENGEDDWSLLATSSGAKGSFELEDSERDLIEEAFRQRPPRMLELQRTEHTSFVGYLDTELARDYLVLIRVDSAQSVDSREPDFWAAVCRFARRGIEEVQRSRGDIRQRSRAKVARVFGRTAAVMNSILRPPEIMSQVLNDMSDIIDVDRVVGILGDGDEIDFVVEHGTEVSSSIDQELVEKLGFWGVQREGEIMKLTRPREQEGATVTSLVVPIQAQAGAIGMLILEREGDISFGADSEAIAQSFARYISVALENTSLYDELKRSARVDDLTGLWNRGYCFELAEREFKRAERHDDPVLVVMLDLDHFSAINNEYGHPIGDAILAEVASSCSDNLREIDLIGRYGGEEFMIVLPQTPLEKGVEVVADRLRTCISESPVETNLGEIPITASFGVARYHPRQDTLSTVISRADRALSIAKKRGRNCVVSEKSVEEENHDRGDWV